MTKGTIVYIGGFQLPDKNAAAHRVISNSKIFRELDYDVVLIGIDKSLDFNQNTSLSMDQYFGFDCWAVGYPKSYLQWIKYLCDIKNYIKIIESYNNVKFVVCYNFPAIALNGMIKYCKKKSIKIVGDCTEWYSTKGSNLLFKIIKGFDSFLRMRYLQKKLDGLIVISRYLENYYSKHIKTICVPPLIDKNEEKWKSDGFFTDKDVPVIVYFGEPGKKDKINLIIDLLAALDVPFVFKIIGISKEQYLKLYPKHYKLVSNMTSNIQFLGRMPHQDTLEVVKGAHFSCFFRNNDLVSKAGFPTKFVESIACGTPVITNKTSNLEEYLISSSNGFFINIGTYSAKYEISQILKHEFHYINFMKTHCKKTVVFNYTEYLNQFSDIFEAMNKNG